MSYLVAGLLLFFSVHLIPLVPPLRGRLQRRLGAGLYRLLFAVVSLLGLVLVVLGMAGPAEQFLWYPVDGARVLAMMVMPLAWVLVAAAYMPCHLRVKLRHPMLLGVLLWAGVHLLANGDLKSSLLFGAFALYALVDMAFSRRRDSMIPKGKPRLIFDVLAVVVGLGLFALVMHGHGTLFGVPLVRA